MISFYQDRHQFAQQTPSLQLLSLALGLTWNKGFNKSVNRVDIGSREMVKNTIGKRDFTLNFIVNLENCLSGRDFVDILLGTRKAANRDWDLGQIFNQKQAHSQWPWMASAENGVQYIPP